MSNRIHIVRSGKQFYSVSVGANGEPLHNSELETRKANVWKNIIADFQQVVAEGNESFYRPVQDDTLKRSVVYELFINGTTRKAQKVLSNQEPSKPYIPRSKRKKK